MASPPAVSWRAQALRHFEKKLGNGLRKCFRAPRPSSACARAAAVGTTAAHLHEIPMGNLLSGQQRQTTKPQGHLRRRWRHRWRMRWEREPGSEAVKQADARRRVCRCGARRKGNTEMLGGFEWNEIAAGKPDGNNGACTIRGKGSIRPGSKKDTSCSASHGAPFGRLVCKDARAKATRGASEPL